MATGEAAAVEGGARQQEEEEEGSGSAEPGESGSKRKAELSVEEIREGYFLVKRAKVVVMRDAWTQSEMGSSNTMRRAEVRKGSRRSGRRPDAGEE